MQGQTVFRWAVWQMAPVAQQAMEKAGISAEDLDAFIPHQANMRITDAMVKAMRLPPQIPVARDIATTGNTSAASIPLAGVTAMMSVEAMGAGPGDAVLIVGASGGVGSFAVQMAAKRGAHVIATDVAATDERCSIEVESKIQYRNMRDTLKQHPEIVAHMEEAVRRVGLEPKLTAIRGGTDGSALTQMGLPTPNIFTGGHDAHSEREWICVEDMGLAAATLVELAREWAE